MFILTFILLIYVIIFYQINYFLKYKICLIYYSIFYVKQFIDQFLDPFIHDYILLSGNAGVRARSRPRPWRLLPTLSARFPDYVLKIEALLLLLT